MNTAAKVIQTAAPIAVTPFTLTGKTGLICVDPVNGFCTVGCGPLAPAVPNAQVERMIAEMDRLAKRLIKQGSPVQVFLDTHVPGRAEPPYPPHCEIGTGQEEIVDALAWMHGNPSVEILKKDVINGVIGAIRPDGSNSLFGWIRKFELDTIVFTGICTDICVADAVLTMLSARNHYHDDKPMLPTLRNIVVYEPGCSTYHLPADVVASLGLPVTATHDQELFHHMGLTIMQSRGAVIASEIVDG